MRTLPHTALYAAALLLLLATAGCDSNSDEDDSDFAVFAQGDWTVTELVVSGSDVTSNLNARYESDVVLTFVENDNENTRSFDLFARANEGENLSLSGRIDIDGEDDIIFFIPDAGPNFDLDYRIESTGRILLFADDTNPDGATLRNILLQSSIGGSFPEVRMAIERSIEDTN